MRPVHSPPPCAIIDPRAPNCLDQQNVKGHRADVCFVVMDATDNCTHSFHPPCLRVQEFVILLCSICKQNAPAQRVQEGHHVPALYALWLFFGGEEVKQALEGVNTAFPFPSLVCFL